MNPIYLLVEDDDELREILYKALVRSFSRSQVCILDPQKPIPYSGSFYVLANVDACLHSFDTDMLLDSAKFLFLGRPDRKLAGQLKLTNIPFRTDTCAPAEANTFSTSKTSILYCNHPLTQYVSQTERALCRYDFKNVWNNLGYGEVKADGSIWSIAASVQSPYSIANISNPEGGELLTYAAVLDDKKSSILWINRQAGSIDSPEWYMVERFFSSYRSADMPCIARLLDIPANTESVVTIRLDYNKDVVGLGDLFTEYNALRVPLSLSVNPDTVTDRKDAAFLHTVIGQGGAVLSNHTMESQSDPSNYKHIAASRTVLAQSIQQEIPYAVYNMSGSPKLLEDIGCRGGVAGCRRVAPHYLMFRGGNMPFSRRIISRYQPCMLHGDCMLADCLDPLLVYKQAFMNSLRTQSIFSFFAQPFSDTNKCGWQSAQEQMRAHRELIGFIRGQANVAFINENECLDFMSLKSNCEICYTQSKGSVFPQVVYASATSLRPALEWKGTIIH